MADISQLLELLKQRAFLEEGGGRPDRIAQVGQALNNLGTGIQKGVGAYQDARDRNLIAAKAIFELEHAKSDAQPFGHEVGVPTQREDDTMKQIFSNKQSTNVAPNVFPQPTPELENAPPPPAPVQAPFIDPRQARIKELTAQGLNIPPALYDIPRKDIKDVAGANLGFSNANLRNAMAGQLGKTIWFNPSTLDVQPAIPGQIPPTGYSEWGLNNALKESSKGGLETKKASEMGYLFDAQGHIVPDKNGNPTLIPKGSKGLPAPKGAVIKPGDMTLAETKAAGGAVPKQWDIPENQNQKMGDLAKEERDYQKALQAYNNRKVSSPFKSAIAGSIGVLQPPAYPFGNQSPLDTPNQQMKYSSPLEVKVAVSQGKITKEQGLQILNTPEMKKLLNGGR